MPVAKPRPSSSMRRWRGENATAGGAASMAIDWISSAIATTAARLPGLSSLQIIGGNQKETTDEPEMLKERILGRVSLRQRRTPEAVGEKRRHQGKPSQHQRASPTKEAAQDQERSADLHDDHGDRERRRRTQTELLHLGNRSAEIERLGQAALQIGAAEKKQRDPA